MNCKPPLISRLHEACISSSDLHSPTNRKARTHVPPRGTNDAVHAFCGVVDLKAGGGGMSLVLHGPNIVVYQKLVTIRSPIVSDAQSVDFRPAAGLKEISSFQSKEGGDRDHQEGVRLG